MQSTGAPIPWRIPERIVVFDDDVIDLSCGSVRVVDSNLSSPFHTKLKYSSLFFKFWIIELSHSPCFISSFIFPLLENSLESWFKKQKVLWCQCPATTASLCPVSLPYTPYTTLFAHASMCPYQHPLSTIHQQLWCSTVFGNFSRIGSLARPLGRSERVTEHRQ